MARHTFDYNNRDFDPAMPMVDVVLRGTRTMAQSIMVSALVDSGADATMFPITLLQQVNARYVGTRNMRGVAGFSFPVNLYSVVVVIGSIEVWGIQAIGMRNSKEAIIGRDVLNQVITTLNGLAYTLEISDH